MVERTGKRVAGYRYVTDRVSSKFFEPGVRINIVNIVQGSSIES